jgi:hypothetical protein
MSNYPVGVQATGTVTVGASGTAELIPAQSNSPFTDLSISVIPIEAASPYTVILYQDGEVLEEHTEASAADRVVTHMSFPNMIFPANVGTDAVTRFFSAGKFAPEGMPITLEITNLSATAKVFGVYASYAEFDSPRFRKLTQL